MEQSAYVEDLQWRCAMASNPAPLLFYLLDNRRHLGTIMPQCSRKSIFYATNSYCVVLGPQPVSRLGPRNNPVPAVAVQRLWPLRSEEA